MLPANNPSEPAAIGIGAWRAWRASGELVGADGVQRLEPKVMDLLFALAARPQGVWSRDELFAQLWPGLVVGEDTLARTVSKLRKALGDDPRAPRYIETISKRGYRWIAPVHAIAAATPFEVAMPETAALATVAVETDAAMQPPSRPRAPTRPFALACALGVAVLALAGWLGLSLPQPASAQSRAIAERAGDFYMRFSRADNEAAIDLYERLIATDPDYAPAYAGLANALVQRVLRWPHPPGQGPEYTKLGDALSSGSLDTPSARDALRRAQQMAEQAVRLAPRDAASHKAFGFVLSAQADFDAALAAYRQAVALDPDAWAPLINIGDVLEIRGRDEAALPYFEAAYAAMTRVYEQQKSQLLPWYADTGVLVADRHRALGHTREAEQWYRRVLEFAPMHPAATTRLADLLRRSGRADAAQRLCADLQRRVGRNAGCATPAG